MGLSFERERGGGGGGGGEQLRQGLFHEIGLEVSSVVAAGVCSLCNHLKSDVFFSRGVIPRRVLGGFYAYVHPHSYI